MENIDKFNISPLENEMIDFLYEEAITSPRVEAEKTIKTALRRAYIHGKIRGNRLNEN